MTGIVQLSYTGNTPSFGGGVVALQPSHRPRKGATHCDRITNLLCLLASGPPGQMGTENRAIGEPAHRVTWDDRDLQPSRRRRSLSLWEVTSGRADHLVTLVHSGCSMAAVGVI